MGIDRLVYALYGFTEEEVRGGGVGIPLPRLRSASAGYPFEKGRKSKSPFFKGGFKGD